MRKKLRKFSVKPYPIKPEEGFEVVRVTEMVKRQNPAYPIKDDEFGK